MVGTPVKAMVEGAENPHLFMLCDAKTEEMLLRRVLVRQVCSGGVAPAVS